MRRYRLPATLLNGRLRTSTLLLSLLFLAVLTLYVEVRPAPVGNTSSSNGRALGDPLKPDHLAVATRRRTVFPFER